MESKIAVSQSRIPESQRTATCLGQAAGEESLSEGGWRMDVRDQGASEKDNPYPRMPQKILVRKGTQLVHSICYLSRKSLVTLVTSVLVVGWGQKQSTKSWE